MAFLTCEKCGAKLDPSFQKKECPFDNPILKKFSMQEEVVRKFTFDENGFILEYDTFVFSVQGKKSDL